MLLAPEALRVDLVDVLGTGGPRGEPAVLGDHLEAADLRAVSRRFGEPGADRLAGERLRGHLIGGQLLQDRLLLRRRGSVDARVVPRAKLGHQLASVNAWVLPSPRQDLSRKQVEQDAVFVGGPSRPVLAQERCSGALLASETERSVEKPIDEPLEPDGNFAEWPSDLLRDTIDEARGDERLSHRGLRAPAGP